MARILIVEDNENNRDMLSRRLIRRGFEVLLAMDGQQGVEMANAENPDVILMDMSLPVLDGWEASRQLKSNKATNHIPIIGLSAHAMSGDDIKAREAGCDDYDTKPVELPRLLKKIHVFLDASSSSVPGEKEDSTVDQSRAVSRHDLLTPINHIVGSSTFVSGHYVHLTIIAQHKMKALHKDLLLAIHPDSAWPGCLCPNTNRRN